MEKLKDNIIDSDTLANALCKNGLSHVNYKMYMSMEAALSFMLTGVLYLTDGSRWNDTYDREEMKKKNAFAKSFSYSTNENVAMWMLYGTKGGRKGAMINFYPSIMHELVISSKIELGSFINGKFESAYQLKSSNKDYEIFLTDLLYIEKCNNSMVRISEADDHITVHESLINHEDIFRKNYPWYYEKECRLVVKLSDKWKKRALEEMTVIRLQVSDLSLKKLKKGKRLVRSPIYENGVDFGIPSSLTGEVEWII